MSGDAHYNETVVHFAALSTPSTNVLIRDISIVGLDNLLSYYIGYQPDREWISQSASLCSRTVAELWFDISGSYRGDVQVMSTMHSHL